MYGPPTFSCGDYMDGVKVAGLWEQNWLVPLTESYLWTFPMRDFGISEWAMWPTTGIIPNGSTINLTEYNDMELMVNEFSEDYTRVFVDEQGDELFSEFEHPEKAVYFFGNVGRTPLSYKRPQDKSIRIKTIKDKGMLWPHQCMTIVLYDRLMKL